MKTLVDLQSLPCTSTPKRTESIAPSFKAPQVSDNADAMDKIVSHYDASPTTDLKVQDAIDQIINNVCVQENSSAETLNVETAKNKNQPSKDSSKGVSVHAPKLNVETFIPKPCHVCVTPLESIVFDTPKTPPTVVPNNMPTGEHYTRSQTRKPCTRTSRIPLLASTGMQYREQYDSDSASKKKKPVSSKPHASGPIRHSGVSAENQIIPPYKEITANSI